MTTSESPVTTEAVGVEGPERPLVTGKEGSEEEEERGRDSRLGRLGERMVASKVKSSWLLSSCSLMSPST